MDVIDRRSVRMKRRMDESALDKKHKTVGVSVLWLLRLLYKLDVSHQAGSVPGTKILEYTWRQYR